MALPRVRNKRAVSAMLKVPAAQWAEYSPKECPATNAARFNPRPSELSAASAAIQVAINAAEGRERKMLSIERFAFYDQARDAYAVIQSGERRFYGCFIFRKGVIAPDA